MTQSNLLPIDFSWGDYESGEYLKILSLPTLPWATCFMPLLGLPNALLENPSIWESIYKQAFEEHETRYRMRNWTGSAPGERALLTRSVITKALKQLAELQGRDVALDLEYWARLHFFCPEARRAISMWGTTLRFTNLSEKSRNYHRKIPPPACLEPILPDIINLVDLEVSNQIWKSIESVAPPPPYEQIPYEYMEYCYEATLLGGAFPQALTLKALQTIASRLNDTERQEVVTWAENQTLARTKREKPEILCGSKYLQVKLPKADLPSILDDPEDF